MARHQRRELRISLVVRSDKAPKVFETLSQVERGGLNGRVVELLGMAVGDAPLPSSSLACLERIERTLASIRERLAAMGAGDVERTTDRSAGREPTGRKSSDKDGFADLPRPKKAPSDTPSQDEISDAERLLGNLGVDD